MLFFGYTQECCKFGCQKMAAVIYLYFSLTEKPVKPPSCMKTIPATQLEFEKGTDFRNCSFKWDWAQVSALWFTLPSAQDIPTGCCLCPGELSSAAALSPRREGTSPAAGGSCTQLLYWLCQTAPSPIPVLIPSIFYEFSTSLFHTRGSENSSFFQRSLLAPSLQHMHFTRIPYSFV